MKHLIAALAATTVVLAGCSDSSQFPEPTGKGALRAINAISTSPQFAFRVEESGADNRFFVLNYRTASGTIRLDDFSYNFNFEVAFAGATSAERVATVPTQIEANRDYTFVITGAVADPDDGEAALEALRDASSIRTTTLPNCGLRILPNPSARSTSTLPLTERLRRSAKPAAALRTATYWIPPISPLATTY